jgi:hypothetical protein
MPRTESPETYLKVALSEIPRVLSLQDRNPLSPTYGCFHRSFWLHRTSDFPSSINQMGVHSLALVWALHEDENPYYQSERILKWAVAGITYWIGLQKRDGSFDEWYPNERGWAGPTGYLVHAMVDSFHLLGAAFPPELLESFKKCVLRAGRHLVRYKEKHVLANHHAIALLPIYEAYQLTGDQALLKGFHRHYGEFLTLCSEEGWSLEYDGPDIGYLSGTISFLSRLHRHWKDDTLERVILKHIDFSKYFLFPNGSFGGSIGSRETCHFYPFGYEYWAEDDPTAMTMAENALRFLREGRMLTPGTQEDHYVLYRVPEFVEAYKSHSRCQYDIGPLPWEEPDFSRYFPDAGIYITKANGRYGVVNLKRGGVVKCFDICTGDVIQNDNGWLCQLADGTVITSQWNGAYTITQDDGLLTVSGQGYRMVTKQFTPLRMIIFRLFMLATGFQSRMAYLIKSLIRRMLTVGGRAGPISFERTVDMRGSKLTIQDTLVEQGGARVTKLCFGGNFSTRYVPQSRYFQEYELELTEEVLETADLEKLRSRGTLIRRSEV